MNPDKKISPQRYTLCDYTTTSIITGENDQLLLEFISEYYLDLQGGSMSLAIKLEDFM